MKRLSIERLYSVIQPAKNSPAYCGPAIAHTPKPKMTAKATKIVMKRPASFIDGSCGRRPRISTSMTRIATITTTVMIHA
jgi:hypothetical protein